MPSFSITPARITDPAVGASVWASGSHVCRGNSGTLTAKASVNARKIQRTTDQSHGAAPPESSTTFRSSAISTRSNDSGWPSRSSATRSDSASDGSPPASATISCASARFWSSMASRCRYAMATMPTSISAEPNIVNRKNFSAA